MCTTALGPELPSQGGPANAVLQRKPPFPARDASACSPALCCHSHRPTPVGKVRRRVRAPSRAGEERPRSAAFRSTAASAPFSSKPGAQLKPWPRRTCRAMDCSMMSRISRFLANVGTAPRLVPHLACKVASARLTFGKKLIVLRIHPLHTPLHWGWQSLYVAKEHQCTRQLLFNHSLDSTGRNLRCLSVTAPKAGTLLRPTRQDVGRRPTPTPTSN